MLCMWSEEDHETYTIESPHRATIILLLFSLQGGRLISADIVSENIVYTWQFFLNYCIWNKFQWHNILVSLAVVRNILMQLGMWGKQPFYMLNWHSAHFEEYVKMKVVVGSKRMLENILNWHGLAYEMDIFSFNYFIKITLSTQKYIDVSMLAINLVRWG